jgi:gamma-glutamylcyclotransferase (GGCT)/AIG2-like uncharacterized protein YtfP
MRVMSPSPWDRKSLYFAYDANLSLAHMRLWCPDAEPLVKAELVDWRLVFRTWADIVPSQGDFVRGALYEIGSKDLAALDKLQDVPELYHRIWVRVLTRSGAVEAIAYRMDPGHPLAAPDPDYLNLITQGYEDWALSAAESMAAR